MECGFVCYLDLECVLEPVTDPSTSATIKTQRHVPCGFCYLIVSTYEKYNNYTPYLYSGPNVMQHLQERLELENERIYSILSVIEPMIPLTPREKKDYDDAEVCNNCEEHFENYKNRHHCHVTGRYLFPSCTRCNLQMKFAIASKEYTGRKKVEGKEKDFETGRRRYYLPVIIHNGKNYDNHLIISLFNMTDDQSDKTDDERPSLRTTPLRLKKKISVIPTTGEKFISFTMGDLRFIDSCQFLSASLDKLVSTLAKNDFNYTAKHIPKHEMVMRKGIFPYEYLTSTKVFEETQLPPIEKFYSSLTEATVSQDDYDYAHKIWDTYNMKTFHEYHDFYLKTDVTLLADVFEKFRKTALASYKLDPAHYYTLPGFAFDAMLKMTKIELTLISDPTEFLFYENAIRGGVSMISNRHAVANNPLVPDYDPSVPTSYIQYLDANNLYGWAMSQPLPVGEHKFLSDEEVEAFDVTKVDENGSTGYVLEVDLLYPDHLHDLHNDLPLAPEKTIVTTEMLSAFSKSLITKHHPAPKLVPNLMSKTKYVIHFANLKLYLRLGMQLTKVHRIISFRQSAWMKPFIDFNTRMRQGANNDFDKDLYKLMSNSVYGEFFLILLICKYFI